MHGRVGGNFILRFERRLVPMVMRRGEVGGRVYFVFQIAYVVDETTAFSGMQIFVGALRNPCTLRNIEARRHTTKRTSV